jgi:hypothetical protein
MTLYLPISASAESLGCSGSLAREGSCSGAQSTGGGVDVWAQQSSGAGASGGGSAPGRAATTGGGSATGAGSGSSATAPWSFYPRVFDTPRQAWGNCLVLINRAPSCVPDTSAVTTPATAPVIEVAYVAPVITAADVVSFSPQQPTLVTEPRGWAIVGLESNMMAGTGTHVVGGSLLGAAAEVRFTPANFEFAYGDGTSRTAPSAGSSWESLGVSEFTRTTTSHAYVQAGSFQASVRVGFSLEYRWGSGAWTSIDGLAYSNAPAHVVLAQNAVNVLVTQSCHQGIFAPGC